MPGSMKRVTVDPRQANSIAPPVLRRRHKTLGNLQINDSDATSSLASPSGWYSGSSKPATPPLPPVEKIPNHSANQSPVARSTRRYKTIHAGALSSNNVMSESTSLPALSDSRPLSPRGFSPPTVDVRRSVRRSGALKASASSANLLGTQPARSLLRRSDTAHLREVEQEAPAVSKYTRSQHFAQNRIARRSRTVLPVDTEGLPQLGDSPTGSGSPKASSPKGASSPKTVERRSSRAVTYAQSPPVSYPPSKEKGDMRAPLLATRHRLELHEVRHILREFDEMLKSDGKEKDEQSKVSMDDFQRFLCRVFEVPSLPDDTLRGAAQACCGADGRITVEAFLLWYHINMFTVVNSLNSDTRQLSANSMIYDLARKHQVSTMVIDKVKAKFDQYDTDGSGFLDLDEFRYLLTVLMKVKTDSDLSQDRVLRAWKEIDSTGSGGVDFAEFTEWYLKYLEPMEEDGPASRGPAEAFYDSFNPMVQRRLVLDKAAKERAGAW